MFGAMIGDDLASPGILDTFEFMATEPSSARSTQQLSVEMQPQRENSTSSLGGFFLESGTVDQPSNSLESVVGAGTGGSLLLHGGRKRRRASDDFGHSRIIESDQCSDHDDRHLKAPNHPPHTSQEATIESLKREVAELLSARTLVGLGCYTAPLAPGPQAALAHARRQAARAFLHYRCASVMQPQWWKVIMDDGFILNAPSIPLCLVNGHLKSLEDKIAACSNKTAKGQRIGVDGMVAEALSVSALMEMINRRALAEHQKASTSSANHNPLRPPTPLNRGRSDSSGSSCSSNGSYAETIEVSAEGHFFSTFTPPPITLSCSVACSDIVLDGPRLLCHWVCTTHGLSNYATCHNDQQHHLEGSDTKAATSSERNQPAVDFLAARSSLGASTSTRKRTADSPSGGTPATATETGLDSGKKKNDGASTKRPGEIVWDGMLQCTYSEGCKLLFAELTYDTLALARLLSQRNLLDMVQSTSKMSTSSTSSNATSVDVSTTFPGSAGLVTNVSSMASTSERVALSSVPPLSGPFLGGTPGSTTSPPRPSSSAKHAALQHSSRSSPAPLPSFRTALAPALRSLVGSSSSSPLSGHSSDGAAGRSSRGASSSSSSSGSHSRAISHHPAHGRGNERIVAAAAHATAHAQAAAAAKAAVDAVGSYAAASQWPSGLDPPSPLTPMSPFSAAAAAMHGQLDLATSSGTSVAAASSRPNLSRSISGSSSTTTSSSGGMYSSSESSTPSSSSSGGSTPSGSVNASNNPIWPSILPYPPMPPQQPLDAHHLAALFPQGLPVPIFPPPPQRPSMGPPAGYTGLRLDIPLNSGFPPPLPAPNFNRGSKLSPTSADSSVRSCGNSSSSTADFSMNSSPAMAKLVMPTTPRDLEALMEANGGLIPMDVLQLMVASLGVPHSGNPSNSLHGLNTGLHAVMPRSGPPLTTTKQMPPPPSPCNGRKS